MRARFIKQNVYGRWLYRPDSELAKSFCELAGRKSLSDRHIMALTNIPIDFEIEIIPMQLSVKWVLADNEKEA